MRSDEMKCELLAEQNLALMLDFVDDEDTKYDEAVLKAYLNERNAYGYIASDNGKAVGFACVRCCAQPSRFRPS